MSFTPATVVESFAPNPRLRRLRLRVDSPESLALGPGADSAVGVYFDVASPNHGRTYSVRRQAGNVLDLDILVHPGGPGSRWAQTAGVGDRVGLDHARAWYRPPPGTTWQLLVADLAGLPALARIMDESPPTVPTTVMVEALDRGDLDYLPTRAGVTLIPSLGSGNGGGASRLAQLVRDLELPAGGYCWFGGEAGASREVRKHLRGCGWTIDQYDVMGYWRHDSAAWDARFAMAERTSSRCTGRRSPTAKATRRPRRKSMTPWSGSASSRDVHECRAAAQQTWLVCDLYHLYSE